MREEYLLFPPFYPSTYFEYTFHANIERGGEGGKREGGGMAAVANNFLSKLVPTIRPFPSSFSADVSSLPPPSYVYIYKIRATYSSKTTQITRPEPERARARKRIEIFNWSRTHTAADCKDGLLANVASKPASKLSSVTQLAISLFLSLDPLAVPLSAEAG